MLAWRSCLSTVLFLLPACALPAFPGLSNPDLGTGRDSGPSNDDGGPDLGYRGDGGPILPPADVDVVLPYGASAEIPINALSNFALLDVHFSIDTTGSFREEIEALKRDLTASIVPALRMRVDNVALGVSRFEDLAVEPFGDPGDRAFTLVTAVTTSIPHVENAVASLDMPLGSGGDAEEAGAEALYQIATGEGLGSLVAAWNRIRAPGGGTRAGVGFREGALPVVVHVTDAPTHTPSDYAAIVADAHSLQSAIAALRAEGIYVVGIASGDAARGYLEEVAAGTGAVEDTESGACRTGIDGATHPPVSGMCPLVFDIDSDGTGLSSSLVDAIVRLLDNVRIHEAYGVASEDSFHFVQTIAALSAMAPSSVPTPGIADLHPSGDGVGDTFTEVAPGTTLNFGVMLRNNVIENADYDQVFRIRLSVRGDGLILAERTVRVTVPRVSGFMDASAGDASLHDAALAGDF